MDLQPLNLISALSVIFVCVVQQMDFLKWSLGQSRRGKCRGQITMYWYQITCMDVDLAKHYYKWKKINKSVESWTK
jgi:hypothetical protein